MTNKTEEENEDVEVDLFQARTGLELDSNCGMTDVWTGECY